ncbi:hypothetical protein [Lysinibacillus sp. FJAT-14222]|uniref:hypothetical protein n=1 Tax=Lysinibacillus sp. FJAT-14222 TaxID=1932366 RepID=UPI0013011ADA|nr:hypothetical protein [Lysinibacillus sp. FJAT-14222]
MLASQMRPWNASESAHQTPPRSSALRDSICAKAKRQQQSAQSERKSTPCDEEI